MTTYKLGSLFDGSGGFPLAGALCGIEPVWASEVEPYPIAVTKSRFKNMKHLGDISKINGAEIEPVDIITFGSPCQDLSVAGKRAGLKHEANGDDETTRSGLFIEAVRIIKEMRKATNGEYPRYAIWENVPGAFSSNKGEDFRVVLEELIKVVEPSAVMPEVPQKGWNYADCYTGDGWSLAYRVLDAQYWGVPQRRRRIYLVTDFRGECAKEILFEREGLRGYFTQGRTPWKNTSSYVEGSSRADDREGEVPYTLKIRSGVSVDSYGKAAGKGALIQENLSATLGTSQDQYLFQPVGADPYNGDLTGDKSMTVTCAATDAHHVPCAVVPEPTAYSFDSLASNSMKSSNPHSGCREVDISKTLDTFNPDPSKNQGGIAIVEPIIYTRGYGGNVVLNGVSPTLEARAGTGGNNQPIVALEGNGQRPSHRGDGYSVTDKSYTLNTTEVHGVAYGLDAYNQALTGEKTKTLNSVATDSDHVPCTVYSVDQGGGKSSANVTEEKAPTLCTTHGGEPAVAYSFDPGASRDVGTLFIEECGKTLTNGTCPGHHDGVVIAERPIHSMTTGSFMQVNEEISPTLAARDYKDPTCVEVFDIKQRKYIVRRLTPTECARLQGFADRWGDIDTYKDFTDEEYAFWHEVRKTHDAINGRAEKDYTKAQMLTWYNKLHADSSEYKMWGNGIALPTALYVMQGIAEALSWSEFEV